MPLLVPMLWGGKPLIRNGVPALGAACCCADLPTECCGRGNDVLDLAMEVTFTGNGLSHYDFGADCTQWTFHPWATYPNLEAWESDANGGPGQSCWQGAGTYLFTCLQDVGPFGPAYDTPLGYMLYGYDGIVAGYDPSEITLPAMCDPFLWRLTLDLGDGTVTYTVTEV